MLNVKTSQQPVNVMHPEVHQCYLKKDLTRDNHEEAVLVIETKHNNNEETEFFGFDSYLVDLLIDLQDLKNEAEEKIGHIDRVDIRRA